MSNRTGENRKRELGDTCRNGLHHLSTPHDFTASGGCQACKRERDRRYRERRRRAYARWEVEIG